MVQVVTMQTCGSTNNSITVSRGWSQTNCWDFQSDGRVELDAYGCPLSAHAKPVYSDLAGIY